MRQMTLGHPQIMVDCTVYPIFSQGTSILDNPKIDSNNPRKQLINERKPGYLGYIEYYTTKLCGDYFINHYEDPY